MDPSMDWLFQAAQDHVHAEWAVIRGAPDGLIILIVISVIVIWLSMRTHYSRVIEIKNATIEMLERQNAEPSRRSRRSGAR